MPLAGSLGTRYFVKLTVLLSWWWHSISWYFRVAARALWVRQAAPAVDSMTVPHFLHLSNTTDSAQSRAHDGHSS